MYYPMPVNGEGLHVNLDKEKKEKYQSLRMLFLVVPVFDFIKEDG